MFRANVDEAPEVPLPVRLRAGPAAESDALPLPFVSPIDPRVRQLYEARFKLMHDAGIHAIRVTLGQVARQSIPLVCPIDATLSLPRSAPKLRPAVADFLELIWTHPISLAAIIDILGYVEKHTVLRDTSVTLPKTGDAVFKLALNNAGGWKYVEKKFTLEELDGPLDAELRSKLGHPFLTHSSLSSCIPVVSWVDYLAAFLYHLVTPFWEQDAMEWYPHELHGKCALSGREERFYSHPYHSDIAIEHARVARQRVGSLVRVLLLGLPIDGSEQHKKKILNMMITIYPRTQHFRTDRARETFLTMDTLAIPKEIKAPPVRSALRNLGASLYHHALYEGFVAQLNPLTQNGTWKFICMN